MTQDFPFERCSDPLYRSVPLPYATRIAVLGIPTTFRSNARPVIDLIDEALGQWRGSECYVGPESQDEVTIRLIVQDVPYEDAGRSAIIYRMPDAHRLLLTARGAVGISDADRRDAVLYVAPALVHDREHFRYGFMESLTLFIISFLDRLPLHAAAVARDGAALLLAGRAGVGKSTLAYAALRAGMPVMAEDIVWVSLQPHLRVWGLTTTVHLPRDADQFFPELMDAAGTIVASGEEKTVMEVPPDARPDRPVADSARVCLLERNSGPGCVLQRASPEEVKQFFAGNLETGFDMFDPALRSRVEHQVAAPGGWKLGLGTDLSQAVRLLEEALNAMAAG
jgi:hypothetical protein